MHTVPTAHAQIVEEAVTKGAICVKLSLEALHVDQKVDDVAVREAVPESLSSSHFVSLDRQLADVVPAAGELTTTQTAIR
jgi:hypothetical protein